MHLLMYQYLGRVCSMFLSVLVMSCWHYDCSDTHHPDYAGHYIITGLFSTITLIMSLLSLLELFW